MDYNTFGIENPYLKGKYIVSPLNRLCSRIINVISRMTIYVIFCALASIYDYTYPPPPKNDFIYSPFLK